MNFVLDCSVDSISNLKTEFRDRRLAGLDVQDIDEVSQPSGPSWRLFAASFAPLIPSFKEERDPKHTRD